MCGIATLTIDVSMSSRTAASVTAIAMRYLYLYLSSAGATAGATRIALAMLPLPDVHVRGDGHARTQRPVGAESLREADAHRDALHDLREVARRVVGREERELGARRRAQALDHAFGRRAAVGIDFDLHR